MFETVIPERVAPRSRRRLYELLPLSLALHALVAGSIAASALWEVTFPTYTPKTYAAYQIISTPPPPPSPPPPAARRPATPTARAVPVKMPLVAPTIIPDLIPEVVEDVPFVEVPQLPVEKEVGKVGGVEGGETDGQIGGVAGGITVAPPPEVIEIQRDAPLPVGAISQEYPAYPEFAWKRMWEDVLVVRYIIGKDGRVKDVIVLTPPEREEFTRETVSKIRQWRFHPYRDEAGQPKEVAHELTVEFKIVRKGRK